MKDMVSVIIPIYNREKYIEECVKSVLAQTFQNFEIIIVDDGSVDRSLEICQKLSVGEPRIRIINGEHQGVSAARNRGIDIAKGDYIFFIDSDDIIHPTLLETLTQALMTSDAGIAGTQVFSIPEEYWNKVYEIIERYPDKSETEYKTNEEALRITFMSGSPMNRLGGNMIRRDLIGKTRFRTELFIGEDFYFVYENLIKGVSCVFLKEKRYYARLHKNNSSWVYDFDGFMTRFERRRLVYETEEKFGRIENANKQKQEAFAVYYKCLKKNEPSSSEIEKMRKVIRQYHKDIFPVLPFKAKLVYFLTVNFPGMYFWLKKFVK